MDFAKQKVLVSTWYLSAHMCMLSIYETIQIIAIKVAIIPRWFQENDSAHTKAFFFNQRYLF